jgi:hypothetical protein
MSELSDEDLTQFLFALEDQLPDNRPPAGLGKSVKELLDDSVHCKLGANRCVCGGVVAEGDPGVTRCPSCNRVLHESCLSFPGKLGGRNGGCPFCLLVFQNIDPLKCMASWMGGIREYVSGMGKKIEQAERAITDMKFSGFRSSKNEGLFHMRYETIDSESATEMLRIGDKVQELEQKFEEFLQENFTL